jgi:hypothetical protein
MRDLITGGTTLAGDFGGGNGGAGISSTGTLILTNTGTIEGGAGGDGVALKKAA